MKYLNMQIILHKLKKKKIKKSNCGFIGVDGSNFKISRHVTFFKH